MQIRLASVIALVLVVGCGSKDGAAGSGSGSAKAAGPSHDALCKKMMDWVAKDLPKEKPQTDDEKKKDLADCAKDLDKTKKDKPKEYDCTVACIDKSPDLTAFITCSEKCEDKKDKKPDEKKPDEKKPEGDEKKPEGDEKKPEEDKKD